MARPAGGLSQRERAFVREFLVDMCMSAAHKRAGYRSQDHARDGYKVRHRPRVAEAIDRALSKRAARVQVTQDDVIRELTRLGMSNLAGYYREDGTLKPLHELTEDQQRAIEDLKSVERRVGDGPVITVRNHVKLHDKRGALELLGRHFGIFKDRGSLESQDGTGPVVITVRLVKP